MINELVTKFKMYVSMFLGKRNYKWVLSDWSKLHDLDTVVKVLSTERFSRNLKTILVRPNPQWSRALFLTPHQDDETVGAGGTMIILKEMGIKMSCLYITSGSKSDDINDELKLNRRNESQEVWANFGNDITFFDYTDGKTPLDEKAVSRLANYINEKKPSVIFLPFLLDDHNEHRRVNHLLYLSSEKIIDKGFEIWSYPIWSSIIPNIAVDISKVIDEKVRINTFWKSQNVGRDYAHLAKGMSIYNTKFITIKPLPKFVEVFFAVPFEEYVKLANLYYSENMEKIYYDYNLWKSE